MPFKSPAQRRKVMMELRKQNPPPPSEPMSEYERQAQAFLDKHGVRFQAKFADEQRPPPWAEEAKGVHGDRYIITLSKPGKRISFEFWNSFDDMQKGRPVRPYTVLAGLGSDYYAPATFEEFASEYGYDTDSRKAEATYKRVIAFSKKLQGFFTEDEAKDLGEIQ